MTEACSTTISGLMGRDCWRSVDRGLSQLNGRVGGAARAVHRPLEEVLTAMLDGVVPSLDDVPEDMRAELFEMTSWDDARLMQVADATMPEEDQARMAELSTRGPSSSAEQEKQEAVRADYGQITLRKARATALRSIRSGKRLLAESDAA